MAPADLAPVAKTSLLIRRAPDEVFRYFVEPALLTQFWLAKASAPLELGATARWDFLVPGASDELIVEELAAPRRLSVKSADGSRITWTFTEHGDQSSLVSVEQRGFPGTTQEAAATAVEATAGFTLVLAELKLLLEQGRTMALVSDKAQLIRERAPDAHTEPEPG